MIFRADERLEELFDRIEAAPGWLRPGLYGAGLIALFMVKRGGLIILPILFIYLAIASPHDLPAAAGIILGALAAGFAGGLFYGLVGSFVGPLGRTGKVLQFIAGTWVYTVVGVFLIIPLVDPSTPMPLSSSEGWAIATGLGVLFGALLGLVFTRS